MRDNLRVPKIIVQRINKGTLKVIELARCLGITTNAGYMKLLLLCKASGARPKTGRKSLLPGRGRTSEEYRENLDRRYLQGFSEQFLRDADFLNLEELAQKYGRLTRRRPWTKQWAHTLHKRMSGFRRKPRVFRAGPRPSSKASIPNGRLAIQRRIRFRREQVARLWGMGYDRERAASILRVSPTTISRDRQYVRRHPHLYHWSSDERPAA